MLIKYIFVDVPYSYFINTYFAFPPIHIDLQPIMVCGLHETAASDYSNPKK